MGVYLNLYAPDFPKKYFQVEVFEMPYIDLNTLHFSIFRAPLGLLEMPYIDRDISHLSSTRAPLLPSILYTLVLKKNQYTQFSIPFWSKNHTNHVIPILARKSYFVNDTFNIDVKKN